MAQTISEEINPPSHRVTPTTREMTLSEKYWTSSLPRAVYRTVEQVYNDGLYLKRPEQVANSLRDARFHLLTVV